MNPSQSQSVPSVQPGQPVASGLAASLRGARTVALALLVDRALSA